MIGDVDMSITKSSFGKTSDGQAVDLYTLSNSSGMQVGILNYGGIINFLKVPDRHGRFLDIILGYDDVSGYENNAGYLGALIGRCANRIAKGRFKLDGKEYHLYRNDTDNHLHGGKAGFNSKIWDAAILGEKLVLSLLSPDGDEGYDGALSVRVTHTLSDDGTFTWDYFAETDRKTVCNLTNHAYFNLSGHNGGTVLDQYLQIESDAFTESDDQLIPTGAVLLVDGTPMDFRRPHKIGERINADYIPLKLAGGYDHNYAVRGTTGILRDAASGFDENSGISFKLRTTTPGIQLYTGNFLSGLKGKDGAIYRRNCGFCLETQYFPDAVNHPSFEQPVLDKGETYRHITEMKFETK